MAEGSDVRRLSAQTPTRRESLSRSCKRKRPFSTEDGEDLLAFKLECEEEVTMQTTPKMRMKPANKTVPKRTKPSKQKGSKQTDKPKKVVQPTRKKEAEKKAKQKRNCNKETKMPKNAFHGMVKWLKNIPTSEVVRFVNDFTNEERHLDAFKKRRLMESLTASNEIEEIVKSLHSTASNLMLASFADIPKDRHPMYRIKYMTHIADIPKDRHPMNRIKYMTHIKEILGNPNSHEMQWFFIHFPEELPNDFVCVIHSIAAAMFNFLQGKVLEFKSKDLPTNNQAAKTEPDSYNNVLSMLTLAGGCFGKIYKCVRRSVNRILHSKGKHKQKALSAKINFRRFPYQLIMTPRMKKNPNIPVTLKAQDRGWLFLPK